MKLSAPIVGLLIYLGLCYPAEARGPKEQVKETAADMSEARSIFLGWVDLPAEMWSVWGYQDKVEWQSVIEDLNVEFQSSCKGQYLAGRTVTAAKNRLTSDLRTMTSTSGFRMSPSITLITASACQSTS